MSDAALCTKKIALFGGSFDPPHRGHLEIVGHLVNTLKFENIYVIPTGKNPFKSQSTLYKHRYQMVKILFRDISEVAVLDIEAPQEEENVEARYSVDTVKAIYMMLRNRCSKDTLYFVLGSDCVRDLPRWKNIDELFSLVTPLPVIRGMAQERFDQEIDVLELSSSLKEQLKRNAIFASSYAGSSTALRQALKNGQRLDDSDMPQSVYEYIHRHGLYTN